VNLVTLTFRALGRISLCDRPLGPITSLCFNYTVGFSAVSSSELAIFGLEAETSKTVPQEKWGMPTSRNGSLRTARSVASRVH